MFSRIMFFELLLASLIRYGEMMLTHMHTGTSSPPLEIKSVAVATSLRGCTNVTVTYVAMETAQVVWTVGKGFLPQDLNSQITRDDYSSQSMNSSSVCLPTDMDIELLKIHIICEKHSFELHLGLKVSHNMTNIHENVKQYTMIVPKSNEIGVSSRGEGRFHVMVDTSGTSFIFGLLQTEATLIHGRTALRDTAYSFLPDNRAKMVRLKKYGQTESEYHTDVLLRSPKLQKGKTAISVSVACTQPMSIVHRLDMKHVMYIQRGTRKAMSATNQALAIIGEQKQELISVPEQGNALLKCSSVGFPRPNITLYRKDGDKVIPYILPSYTTSLEFEQTKFFQILNATLADAGLYICKAANADASVEKTFMVDVKVTISLRKHPFDNLRMDFTSKNITNDQ